MTTAPDGPAPSQPTTEEQNMAMDRDELVERLTKALDELDNHTGEGLAEMPYQDIAEALVDVVLGQVNP